MRITLQIMEWKHGSCCVLQYFARPHQFTLVFRIANKAYCAALTSGVHCGNVRFVTYLAFN